MPSEQPRRSAAAGQGPQRGVRVHSGWLNLDEPVFCEQSGAAQLAAAADRAPFVGPALKRLGQRDALGHAAGALWRAAG